MLPIRDTMSISRPSPDPIPLAQGVVGTHSGTRTERRNDDDRFQRNSSEVSKRRSRDAGERACEQNPVHKSRQNCRGATEYYLC